MLVVLIETQWIGIVAGHGGWLERGLAFVGTLFLPAITAFWLQKGRSPAAALCCTAFLTAGWLYYPNVVSFSSDVSPIALAAAAFEFIVLGWYSLLRLVRLRAAWALAGGLLATGGLVAFAAGWLIPGMEQPAIHFDIGGPISANELSYTIEPYSRGRNFYSSNPRHYFEELPRLSVWLPWNLQWEPGYVIRGHAENVIDERIDAVRLWVDMAHPDSAWKARWRCGPFRIPAKRACRLAVRGRADPPREIDWVAAVNQEWNTPRKTTLSLNRDWQSFSLEIEPQPNAISVETQFHLGASATPVELADLSFTADGEAVTTGAPLTQFFVQYDVNQRGFRDRDFAIPPPKEVFRITCLGDSFTWGQGVRAADTYPKVLERILNERHGPSSGYRFEVVNCGRCGYGTREELAAYRLEVSRYEPRLVILQMLDNDNEEQASSLGGATAAARPASKGYESCAQDAARLAEECRRRDARLVVMLFRFLGMDWHWRQLHQDLRNGLAEARVPILDVGDAIDERFPHFSMFCHDRWTHWNDLHPNEVVHRYAAEALADFLEHENQLPRAKKQESVSAVLKGAAGTARP